MCYAENGIRSTDSAFLKVPPVLNTGGTLYSELGYCGSGRFECHAVVTAQIAPITDNVMSLRNVEKTFQAHCELAPSSRSPKRFPVIRLTPVSVLAGQLINGDSCPRVGLFYAGCQKSEDGVRLLKEPFYTLARQRLIRKTVLEQFCCPLDHPIKDAGAFFVEQYTGEIGNRICSFRLLIWNPENSPLPCTGVTVHVNTETVAKVCSRRQQGQLA